MANRRVVLIGSVPLPSAATVFSEVSRRIGPACASVPDGETGPRLDWIGWYYGHVCRNPALERVDPNEQGFMPALRLRDGLAWTEVDFRPTGYLDAALQSYATFRDLKERGVIAAGTRFQVSMPTPLMLSTPIVGPRDAVIQAHERALFGELRDLTQAIPGEELTIQWDFAGEIVNAELRRQGKRFRADDAAQPPLAQGVEALRRACEAVPEDVELGVHCCFGDPGGRHIVEPLDAATPVQAIREFLARVGRRVDWVHVPVPIERDDAAYFEPLRSLVNMDRTLLILGLIHQEDGVEGARRRMAAAASASLVNYGVATECGLGRINPAIMPLLLDLHRQVAQLQ